ncbi:P-loop NTPase fold protein [Kribbella sp. NPDC051620]|uniref:P-loop NTPase fold protein n=1 Tax=Kribbella sp. NPDC051620 TaxID=3364120 RepID=UPI003788A74C
MPQQLPRLILRQQLTEVRAGIAGQFTEWNPGAVLTRLRASATSDGDIHSPWGAWKPGDAPLLAAATPWSVDMWLPDVAQWRPEVDFSQPDDAWLLRSDDLGGTTEWGAWGLVDGSPVLALGYHTGSKFGHLLWREDAGLKAFEPGSQDALLWGAWGKVDGAAVLATGGEDGWVRLWDPVTLKERGGIQTGKAGRQVGWGAWGEMDGQPVLATGGDTSLQILPTAALQTTSHSTSVGLSMLPGDETTWGAWGTVDGRSVLAYGGVNSSVRLHDPAATNRSTTIELQVGGESGATTIWGSWGIFNGEPMVVAGGPDGQVWFCDPVSLTSHWVVLGHPVRWGSWGWVNNQPVLAVGDGHGEVRLYDLAWERVVPRVPNYRSDTGGAVDLLGRRDDAAALADVITARSAQPPLAVGLFGQWGDGKSMFLEMLQEQVSERARTAGVNDPIAHGNIRQVRFNAWHYAEADLWASLVAELFAQLSDGANPVREQRQRSRLASELVQARGLREQLGAAEERLADLRQAGGSEDGGWASLTPSARLRLQDLLGADAERLYREAAVTASTTRRSWRSTKRLLKAISWRGWLAAAAGVAGTAALVTWGSDLARWIEALPVVAGLVALAGAGVRGWAGTQPAREAIGSAWQTVRRVRDEQKQRLDTAEAVAAAEVEELRKRLQNLTSAGQLAGVVQERVGAASYRERLGLMTQIRQDFERMAELLRPDEAMRSDVPVEDAAGDELPAIDRIVIYIDDLDRCPPDRVVDVLEAVHLLLAVRLFVVVVAVDPRWLLRSLTSHYRELFAAAEGAQDDDELWAATPAQYLEKIFQIVLTLPPMEQDGYRKMIDDLVGLRTDSDPESEAAAAEAAAKANAVARAAADLGVSAVIPTGGPAAIDAVSRAAAITANAELRAAAAKEKVAEAAWRAPIDLTAVVTERVDPLALTPAEYELINLLGPPLVTGPRSVKRLANSYGLLVATGTRLATGQRSDLEPVQDLEGATPPYRAGMVLLAAVIGFPMLGPSFFSDLHHAALSSPNSRWADHLESLHPTATGNRAELTVSPFRSQQWNDFLSALEKVGRRATAAGQPLPERLSIWSAWVIPVGRLSFPTGSTVTKLMT